MATARGCVDRLSLTAFQCVQGEVVIAGGRHQAQLVTVLEAVFDVDGQPVVVAVEDFTDQLLAAQL